MLCGLSLGGESFGRIVFRKPTKRSSDASNAGLSASSTKKAKTDKDTSHSVDSGAESKSHRTDRTADKAKPNSSLLSFNDDEDDDS